jgi:hypothetical protein
MLPTVSQTKSRSGAVISAANFRSDTNVSGGINASDACAGKSELGSHRAVEQARRASQGFLAN